MNAPAVLEIRIYLQDGHVTRFVQNNAVIAHTILEAIHPNHLFTAPQLLIGSDHVLTAFQAQLVVRVDLLTDLNPSWSTSSAALDTHEITEEDFRTRCYPERDVQRLPSQERVVFGVWEMVTGQRIYLQTHMSGLEKKKLPMDVGIVIGQMMTSGGLLARGRESGYIILNPGSLLRFTSYVGLREMPANALPMRQLTHPSRTEQRVDCFI